MALDPIGATFVSAYELLAGSISHAREFSLSSNPSTAARFKSASSTAALERISSWTSLKSGVSDAAPSAHALQSSPPNTQRLSQIVIRDRPARSGARPGEYHV